VAKTIKKLQAFDCLNYSLRRVKCEWQEAKKKKKNWIKLREIAK